jgi:hypothetical protein
MPFNHKSYNETHIDMCAGTRSRRITENGFRFPAPQAGRYNGAPQAGKSHPAPQAGRSHPTPQVGRNLPGPQAGRYNGAPTALVTQAA